MNGNSKMRNGDEVVISEGVYSCGTCDSSYIMFYIRDLYGKKTR